MSDIAIHQLPAAGPLTGGETVPVDDGTATVRTTVAAIRQGLAAAGHGHAVAEVTGLQAALDARAPLASPVFTGAVKVPAGSAAAPAVASSGDTDSGLYFPAADTLAVTLGGTERVRIDSGGRVSIGAAPVAVGSFDTALQVSSPSSSRIGLHDSAANTWWGASNEGDVFKLSRWSGSGWVERLSIAASNTLSFAGTVIADASGRLALRGYTVATLPSAGTAGRLIYVSDGAGSRRLAVSDGSVWRWPDGATVS